MKINYKILAVLLVVSAMSCKKLDQEPLNLLSSSALTEYDGVLNAAYYYQLGAVTPMAVMGDFRADNAYMEEAPFDDFDKFTPGLTSQENQFFGPFYTALYKSILSANNVIENSPNANQVAEAKFLRGLSYFKLVQVFGDVTVNLLSEPDISDLTALERQAASTVYNTVIIPDLTDAMNGLSATIKNGRASKYAAQGILGKVYMHMGNFSMAQTHLAAVVSGAGGAGISLQANFADIFGESNDLNSEIIFATQVSSSIVDEYGFSEFWSWSGGLDTKSLTPLDPSKGPTIIAAFNANVGDLRTAVSVDTVTFGSPKFPQTGGPDHDWIELRLADVILLLAEALNETTNASGANSVSILTSLDAIRTRANLSSLSGTAISQADVREAIANERRLELAFEGHRWFDLVRTGKVDAAMGTTVNSNYHLFPIPVSEILASFNTITQNPGY